MSLMKKKTFFLVLANLGFATVAWCLFFDGFVIPGPIMEESYSTLTRFVYGAFLLWIGGGLYGSIFAVLSMLLVFILEPNQRGNRSPTPLLDRGFAISFLIGHLEVITVLLWEVPILLGIVIGIGICWLSRIVQKPSDD